jgi:hypothetical protein
LGKRLLGANAQAIAQCESRKQARGESR